MRVLIRIKTKNEIFSCDEFPIVFENYHSLVRWLTQPDNNRLIDRIMYIKEHYSIN